MAETSLIRHLVAKVSMDTAAFTSGAQKAKKEMTGLRGSFDNALVSINHLARLIRGGGAIAGITALAGVAKRASDALREMAASGASADENFEAMIEKLPLLGAGLSIAKTVLGPSTADARKLIRETEMARREMLSALQQQTDSVGMSDLQKQYAAIEAQAEKTLLLIDAMKALNSFEKEELRQAAIGLAQKQQDELRSKELAQALEEEAEANEKIVKSLESLVEIRDKFLNQETYLNARKRRESGIKNSVAADAAFRAEADALIESTMTSAERLEADLAVWKTMFDDGLFSSEVFARLIAGRLPGVASASTPDLAVRGSQQAESLISRQMVGKTEKTQEEMLKEIMKIVRESKSSADLLRQIEKKLGGVNI